MNKSTTNIIITAMVLGAVTGLFFMVRGAIKPSEDKTPKDNESNDGSGGENSGGNSTTVAVEPPKPTYSPNSDAAALHKTMDGGGTNDDDFWKITKRLNAEQKIAVKARFTQMYGSLQDWIEGDFSWGAEDRALKAWGYPA